MSSWDSVGQDAVDCLRADIVGMRVAAGKLATSSGDAHSAMRRIGDDLGAAEAAWSRRTLPVYSAVLARISADRDAIVGAVDGASARISGNAAEYEAQQALAVQSLRAAAVNLPPADGATTRLIGI